MFKIIVAGLLAIVLSSGTALASVPHKALTQAENVTVYVTADVTIHTVDEKGNPQDIEKPDRPICSGSVLLSQGTDELILTAKHCTAETAGDYETIDLTPRDVHFFDGDVGHVWMTYQDPKLDVALLAVHSMRRHPSTIFLTEHLTVAEPLFVYGMPDGMFWSYSSATAMNGDVEMSPAPPQFINAIQIECASCYGGNSGGPVFDMSGNVVGIVNFKGPNSFWMTSSSRINKMLRDLAHGS